MSDKRGLDELIIYNVSAVKCDATAYAISILFRTFTEPKMRRCDLIASFALGDDNIIR